MFETSDPDTVQPEQGSEVYQIVKRTIRTVTTVIWSIRWTDPDGQEAAGEITLPAVYSTETQDLSAPRQVFERQPASHRIRPTLKEKFCE